MISKKYMLRLTEKIWRHLGVSSILYDHDQICEEFLRICFAILKNARNSKNRTSLCKPRPFRKTKLPSKMTYALHSLVLRHSNYRKNSRHLCLLMGMSSASIGKTYPGASWKEHTAMRKNWMCHCTACKQLTTGQHSKTKNTTT